VFCLVLSVFVSYLSAYIDLCWWKISCLHFSPFHLTFLQPHCHQTKNKQTPWPESGSELYRPSHRRLSAKLVPTFADRGVSRSQRGGSPTAVISILYKDNWELLKTNFATGWGLETFMKDNYTCNEIRSYVYGKNVKELLLIYAEYLRQKEHHSTGRSIHFTATRFCPCS
jgi:hypothetical protein